MADKIQILKFESVSTGGTQEDYMPTSANPNEDYGDLHGVYFQSTVSNDKDVSVYRDEDGNLVFEDTENDPVTLSELGGGSDDDQVKVSVENGDTFEIKDGHQQIVHGEFLIDGDLIVDGEQVLIGGDPLKIDDLSTPDDNTDLNASTSFHGLLPKLSGNIFQFLRGDGSWSEPSIVVFDAYKSSSSTISSGDSSWNDVEFNAEGKKTSGFTHSTTVDPEEITIDNDGTYRLTCDITTKVNSGTSRTQMSIRLMLDSGSGFSEIPGTVGMIYNRTLGAGGSSATVCRIIDFSSGDKIKAQVRRESGSSDIDILANGCRLTMERL